MSDIKIQRALIAVYDKTGIAEFARALVDEFGIEILSTGGTAKHLQDAGIPVTLVEKVTGFPELLDGRVKTLHPMIHAGILADRSKPHHMQQLARHNIKPIDMVVVNLYPFEDTIAQPGCTLEQAIEMIDIGGPCMLRAAAKNHQHVLVVPLTCKLDDVLKEMRSKKGCVSLDTRRQGATDVFATTQNYDMTVSGYLDRQFNPSPTLGPATVEELWFDPSRGFNKTAHPRCQFNNYISATWLSTLRYGENPNQRASAWLFDADDRQPSDSCNLVGKTGEEECDTVKSNPLIFGEMSFNNYVDGDAALALVKELTRESSRLNASKAVAFIKHTNACGCAIGNDAADTYRRAYLGDPIAAAGGVLCVNFPVTRAFADVVMNSFGSWGKSAGAAFFKLDMWIATSFDADAVELITTPTEKRKWGASCRLLAVGDMSVPAEKDELDYKKITGGLLVQTRDLVGLNEDQWTVSTQRMPSENELADLRFAWLVCKHTKSNAITIVRDGTLLGNGAGQMSRVKSCDLAIQLARENNHGDQLAGAVTAGDAFFPVEDGPSKLIAAGISAIIHPGGSARDADSIRVANEANVAMIVTGTRHFKH